MGKDTWLPGTVRNILKNEKYCGDALMQKTYTKDYRTHRSVKNTDLNMYFKENHHTAIIKKRGLAKSTKAACSWAQYSQKAKLRLLDNRFIVTRIKDGLFKGYLIVDSRWSFADRQEFMKMIQEPQTAKK